MHMSNWEKCCWDSQGFFPRYQAKTSPPRTRRRKSVMQSTWLPSLGCTWGSMGWLGESWNGNQLNGFLLLAIQILSLALFDTSSIFPCSKPIKFRDQVRDLWHLSQHAILELLLDFLDLTCIYMSAGGGTHTDIHQKNFIWMWAYMQIFHVYQIPKSLLVISRSHFIHLKV